MASKRNERKKKCGQKRRYNNSSEAWASVTALRRKGDVAGIRLTAYKCSFCGLWHIGHKQKRYYGHHKKW